MREGRVKSYLNSCDVEVEVGVEVPLMVNDKMNIVYAAVDCLHHHFVPTQYG